SEGPSDLRVGEDLQIRALALIPTGFAITDLEGRYRFVNAAFCRLLGRPEGELLGAHVRDFTHPADFPRQEEYQRILGKGDRDTFQMEKRYQRPDGREVWATVHSAVLKDETGQSRWLACHIQDVTDRVASERALSKSLDRFSSLLASLDTGVIEVNAEG